MDELVKWMDQLLANPDLMQELADWGRQKAVLQHTWSCSNLRIEKTADPADLCVYDAEKENGRAGTQNAELLYVI